MQCGNNSVSSVKIIIITGLARPWTSRSSGQKAVQAKVQSPNGGHELAIYVVKLCRHNFTQSAYFMIFLCVSISYRPTDLSLSKEFSKNVKVRSF